MPVMQIIIGYAMLLALGLAGTFVIKSKSRDLHGIAEIRWAMMAGLAGLAMLMLRHAVPLVIVTVGGQTALLLGFAFLYAALARALGRPPHLFPLLLFIVPVFVAAITYFTVVDNSFDGRLAVLSIGIALMLAWTARLAAQPAPLGLAAPVRWMFRLLILLVFLRIARLVITLVVDPHPSLIVLDPLQNFLIYLQVLGALAQGGGTFWISICARREDDRIRADTDGLTGLLNRRAFEEALIRQLERAAAGHIELSLLLIDLDFFKSMNDEFGHLAGDTVLRRVSAVLRRSVRAGDALARFGGDEFAVLLCSAEPGQGKIVAERIRQNLIHMRGLPGGRKVTASLGAAEALPGDTPLLLLERADRALYHSKDLGRNRLTHFHEAGPREVDHPAPTMLIQ